MSSRAIVWPGSWGNNTLEQIDLSYVQPLPNALYDWDAYHLSLGPLTDGWASSVDGVRMFQDSLSDIQVVSSGGSPVVKLDGDTDRLRIQYELSTPYTMLAVYRLVAPVPAQTVWYGYLNQAGRLAVSGGNATMNTFDGTNTLAPSPYVPADTNWNIALVVQNSANSVIRINDTEGTGLQNSFTTDGITLGYAGGNTRTPIEFKRLAVIDDVLNLSERNALVAKMRLRYNI